MRKLFACLIAAPLAVCVPASAKAQHTTCMATGATVNCDTIGGGGYQPNNDGGAAFGSGLADLINGIGERNLRRRVGKLLAEGDCEGAARLALEKGRLEMGLAIRQRCRPSPSQQQSAEVSRQLQALAAHARTPAPYGEGLTVTSVQAAGTQLRLTVQYDREGLVPAELRSAAMTEICATEALRPLLRAGAAVRAFYLGPDGAQVANDEVTAGVCGLS